MKLVPAWLAWLLAALLVQPAAAADGPFERPPLAAFAEVNSARAVLAQGPHQAALEQDDRLADDRDEPGDPGILPAHALFLSSAFHDIRPSAPLRSRARAPGRAYRARAPPAM